MKRLIQKETAKQVGTLYHFTSLKSLFKILSEDQLNGKSLYQSLTRNKNFNEQSRTIGNDMECRIQIDGDSLSNKYKIEPYSDKDFFENGFENIYKRKPTPADLEQEERIKGIISPMTPYITEVTIFADNCEEGLAHFRGIFGEDLTVEGLKDTFGKLGATVNIEGQTPQVEEEVEELDLELDDLDEFDDLSIDDFELDF